MYSESATMADPTARIEDSVLTNHNQWKHTEKAGIEITIFIF